MKDHWLRYVSGALLVVVTVLPIHAAARQHSDYLPLTKFERGKTFRLKLLGEFDQKLPLKRAPIGWYSSFAVVIDNAKGREIALLGSPREGLKPLLDRIVNERYRVAVFGQRSADHCSPEMLWAGPKDR